MTTHFTHKVIAITFAASLALAGCASGAASSSDNERDSSSTSRDKDRDSGSDSGSEGDKDRDSDKEKDRDKEADRDKETDSDKEGDSGSDKGKDKKEDKDSSRDKDQEGSPQQDQDSAGAKDQGSDSSKEDSSRANTDKSTDPPSNSSNAGSGTQLQNRDDINVGDCLTISEEEQAVYRLDCSEPHEYEVFHRSSMGTTHTPRPSDEEIDRFMTPLCRGLFVGYVGTTSDRSKYQFDWEAPDEEEWNNGERTGFCLLFSDTEEQTAGSAKR